ncbi:MAG: hypothetical protein AAF514_04420 [Verrucomicrobiota bacterium]
MALQETDAKAFAGQAAVMLGKDYPGVNKEELFRRVLEIVETRSLEIDKTQLMLVRMGGFREQTYHYPDYIFEHAQRLQRRKGDAYRTFLDAVAGILVGPRKDWAATVATHYRPNQGNLSQESISLASMAGFLGHLSQNVRLLAEPFKMAWEMGLIRPDAYNLSNQIENATRSYNIDDDPPAFASFLSESGLFVELDQFRAYQMPNLSRNTFFGYLCYQMGRLDSSERKAVLDIVKTQPGNSFGKELFVGFGSGSSMEAGYAVLEKHHQAIGKAPKEAQSEIYAFLKGYLRSSSIRRQFASAAPGANAWYQKKSKDPVVAQAVQPQARQGMTADRFLKGKSPSEWVNEGDVNYLCAQAMASVFPGDPAKAYRCFEHYLRMVDPATLKTGLPTLMNAFLGTHRSPEGLGFATRLIRGSHSKSKGLNDDLLVPYVGQAMMMGSGSSASNRSQVRRTLQEPGAPGPVGFAKGFFAFSGGNWPRSFLGPFSRQLSQLSVEDTMAFAKWVDETPTAESGIDDEAKEELLTLVQWVVALRSQPIGLEPEVREGLLTRFQDERWSLGQRVAFVGAVLQASAHDLEPSVLVAALGVVQASWKDPETTVAPSVPMEWVVFLKGMDGPRRAERIMVGRQLLVSWSENMGETPIDMSQWPQVEEFASSIEVGAESFFSGITSDAVTRQGWLGLLVKLGAYDSARKLIAAESLFLPAAASGRQNLRSRSGRIQRIDNGQISDANQQAIYDRSFHGKVTEFLATVDDGGKRTLAALILASMADGEGLAESGLPDREARLAKLAKSFDSGAFKSRYLAEQALAWLCLLRPGGAFGKSINELGAGLDSEPLAQWGSPLATPRRTLLNRYFQESIRERPDVLVRELEKLINSENRANPQRANQILNSQFQQVVSVLGQVMGNASKEDARRYLLLLRTLVALPPQFQWNQREACLNLNLGFHALADEMEAYEKWKSEVDPFIRNQLQYSVNLRQILQPLQSAVAGGGLTDERRVNLLGRLFEAVPVNRQRSDDELYERLIQMKLASEEEVRAHGLRWSRAQPRNGMAFAELANYQTRAGEKEAAAFSLLEAVLHVPPNYQYNYFRYHRRRTELLIDLGRPEQALEWIAFLPAGSENQQDEEMVELHRTARLMALANPLKARDQMEEAKGRLQVDSAAREPWKQICEALIATGRGATPDRDPAELAPAFFKAAFFIAHPLRYEDRRLFEFAKQELSRALAADGKESKGAVLIPKGSDWTYFYGSWSGNNWRYAGFDGDSWSEGVGPLGYGNGIEKTVLDYGEDKENKPITGYFRKELLLPEDHGIDQLSLGILHDDGVALYLNGRELVRNNLPRGTLRSSTQATQKRSDDVEKSYWPVMVSGSALRSGVNIIAAEVHQEQPDSSDFGFDLEMRSESMNVAELRKEVDAGTVTEGLGAWAKSLPADWVAKVRALEKATKSR